MKSPVFAGPMSLIFAQAVFASYISTDLETLSDLTVDTIFQANSNICCRSLGTNVSGGEPLTSLAFDQSSLAECGIGAATPSALSVADALLENDFYFATSTTTPIVMDLGTPYNSVVVFDALVDLPIPEQAIPRTVWGRNSSVTTNFPEGWTLATLNAIWQRGWVDPPVCSATAPNSDDYAGQYTFNGSSFQYIALLSDESISLFNTPDHTTWNPLNDSNPNEPGWQSLSQNVDAIATADNCAGQVTADAGGNQTGRLGSRLCFDGARSSATQGIATLGWDTTGDNTIDLTEAEVCVFCDTVKEGSFTLYVTDFCSCAATATVTYTCFDQINNGDESHDTSLPMNNGSGLISPPPPLIPPPPPPPPVLIPAPVVAPALPVVTVTTSTTSPQNSEPSAQSSGSKVVEKSSSSGCSTAHPLPLLWVLALLWLKRRMRNSSH